MRLAISSLAWEPADDSMVRALLSARGVQGVELAPLKYWPAYTAATPSTLAAYRGEWADVGIAIVALQGILFGHPELRLFGTPVEQAGFIQHLARTAEVASALGATAIVLGAPRNRLRGALSEDEAIERAVPVLRRVGQSVGERGCVLCVEPTPLRYGGDFGRSVDEVSTLVDAVDHPGVALHLDAGAVAIVGETDGVVRAAARRARHFHASEIDLLPLGAGTVDHRRVAGLLRQGGYAHWCSLEMRTVPAELRRPTLESALDVAKLAYGE